MIRIILHGGEAMDVFIRRILTKNIESPATVGLLKRERLVLDETLVPGKLQRIWLRPSPPDFLERSWTEARLLDRLAPLFIAFSESAYVDLVTFEEGVMDAAIDWLCLPFVITTPAHIWPSKVPGEMLVEKVVKRVSKTGDRPAGIYIEEYDDPPVFGKVWARLSKEEFTSLVEVSFRVSHDLCGIAKLFVVTLREGYREATLQIELVAEEKIKFEQNIVLLMQALCKVVPLLYSNNPEDLRGLCG